MRLLSTLLACLSVAIAPAGGAVHVAELDLRVDLDEAGRGAIVRGALRLETGSGDGASLQGLRIELTDQAGRPLLARPLVTAASVRDFSLRVADAPRWSAEAPTLATLTISLLDANRTAVATKAVPVGFRQVVRAGGRVYVNGAPVRLRGVVVPPVAFAADERRAQALEWKRANVNALYVPASANVQDWLPLADRHGFYVVTETEASDDVRHPSLLFSAGSCGGKASSDCVYAVSDPATMQSFLKAGARPGSVARPVLVNATLDTSFERPVLAVDLAPAPGELATYWQEIYWHPRLLGAFLASSVDATTAEVKKAYQPVLIERRRMKPGEVVVRVTNRHHHLSLDAYEPRWAVLREGEIVQQGVLPPLALAPNAQPEVPIPVAPLEAPEAGAPYLLRVSFHTRDASPWAPAGHEIACEELPLDVAVPAPSSE